VSKAEKTRRELALLYYLLNVNKTQIKG